MGYNIAGLVINTNYENSVSQLAEDLTWCIEIIEEITFEIASENWTPDGEFRVCFTDQATMIFFPHEWVVEQYHSKTADSLNYAYSATAMAFQVDVFLKGQLTRSIFEVEHEKQQEFGDPLVEEKLHTTADGLTFALFDRFLQESFHQLEFGTKALRCKKTQFETNIVKEVNLEKTNKILEKSPSLKAILKEELDKKSLETSSQKDSNDKQTSPNNRPSKSYRRWWEFWK